MQVCTDFDTAIKCLIALRFSLNNFGEAYDLLREELIVSKDFTELERTMSLQHLDNWNNTRTADELDKIQAILKTKPGNDKEFSKVAVHLLNGRFIEEYGTD